MECKSCPRTSIDLVVTSPPYNLGIRYSKFSDRADRAGYLHWCKAWAAEIARLLRADGSFFLNVGASPANPMFPHQIVLELRDLFVFAEHDSLDQVDQHRGEKWQNRLARSFQADQFATLSE